MISGLGGRAPSKSLQATFDPQPFLLPPNGPRLKPR